MKEELIRAEFEKWYASESINRDNCAIVDAAWGAYLSASAPLLERIAELEKDKARMDWVQKFAFYHATPGYVERSFNRFHRVDIPADIESEDIRAAIDVEIYTALQHKEQT